MGDVYGIGTATHQLFGKFEGPRGGAGKTERSRIGKHSRVEAGGYLRRDFHSGPPGEQKDHFGSGAGAGINPVHVSKGPCGGVVIDVNEVVALEAAQAGAGQAVALQDDGGISLRRFVSGMKY